MMDVILTKDVANLGRAGEIVRVKPGYGRNFLIPRGMALLAGEFANVLVLRQPAEKLAAQ